MILHGVSPPHGSYAQILSLHNFKQVQFILSIIILYSYKACSSHKSSLNEVEINPQGLPFPQLARVAQMRLKIPISLPVTQHARVASMSRD